MDRLLAGRHARGDGRLEAGLAQIEETAEAAADHGLALVEANARAEQGELIVAASLARGDPEPEALAAAEAALARARKLVEAHRMQELAARVGLSEALLTALGGAPDAALARAHKQLDAWRELGRGNRLILGLVATAKVALLANRPDEARPLVSEAIGLIGEFAWAAPLRGAAEVLAVLSSTHDPEAAATLLGVAEARAPTHRYRMPIDLVEVTATLEHTLGAEAVATLRAKGSTLSLDDVVALASAAADAVLVD